MVWTTPRTWTDGELVTAAIMNTHVRDNLNSIGEHRYTAKSSDQSKASNTTLADDSALVMAVGTNQVWEWRARIYIVTGAGGINFRWDAPASSTGDYFILTAAGFSVFQDDQQSYGVAKGATATITDSGHFLGILATAGTSGNLSFAWAQNASNGANTTVKAGSYIMARRIS